MNKEVLEDLKKLRAYRDIHIKLGERMIADEFTGFDLLIITTLNRSMSLTRGFCDLVESENFICAAPLLRLQVDNCLRFSAAWLVGDPHHFAIEIMAGKMVKNMKDRRGKPMTDRYLCDRLAEREPIVADVYKHTSSYIHLSDKHFFNAIRAMGEGRLEMKITDQDAYVSDDVYQQSIHNFRDVTHVLFRFMEGWYKTKTEPEEKRGPPPFY